MDYACKIAKISSQKPVQSFITVHACLVVCEIALAIITFSANDGNEAGGLGSQSLSDMENCYCHCQASCLSASWLQMRYCYLFNQR